MIKNRKMWFTVFSMLLVTGGALFVGESLYPTYVGAILGLTATYVTGNVVQKAVVKQEPKEFSPEA